MRALLVVLTLSVAGLLAWVAWQSHLSALRAAAEAPWTPPECVWSCSTKHVVAAEPGGAPLVVGEPMSLCGYEDRYERERIFVAPKERAAARSRLGLGAFDPDALEYQVSDVKRLVDGHEWRRWDVVSRGR